MDPTGYEAAFFESLQRRINGPRAVAKSSHGGIGKNLSEVIAGTWLLMEQPQESIAEQRILIHSTLRIMTLRIVGCKREYCPGSCPEGSMQNAFNRQRRLFKFAARSGLLWADAASGYFGLEVVLAFHRGAREAPKHGDLADVRECVGNGGLEDSFA